MQESMVIGYGSRRLQWVIVAGCLGLAVCFVLIHFRIGALIPLVFALLCSIVPETRVGAGGKVIERQWRLLGVLPLWRTKLSVSEFRSVFLDWYEGPEPDWRVWKVGLQRSSGSKVIVSYFNVGPGCACPTATSIAKRLADAAGLPLNHEDTSR
jgi:hypothetical protein